MTDLDMLAIGLSIDQPGFARDAYAASGLPIFQEIAGGKGKGKLWKALRAELAAERRGTARIPEAFPIREAVLMALRDRGAAGARMRAVSALLTGDLRAAKDELEALMAPPEEKAKLKVV